MEKRTAPTALKQNAPVAKSIVVTRAVSKDDLHFIRNALLTLGLCIALSAGSVVAARMILTTLRVTGSQLQVRRDEVRDKYTVAETEKMDIRTFQPRFIQLRLRGFVGEEKRLDWIEHIKHIHENRKLLPLTYEISPQQVFQVDPSILVPELELRGSKMKLHMELFREMDLFNFLADLKSKAFYTTQACTMTRVAQSQGNAQPARLAADCTLYWLTIGEHDANVDNPATAAAK